MPNPSVGVWGIHRHRGTTKILYPANRISGVTCDPNMRFVALMGQRSGALSWSRMNIPVRRGRFRNCWYVEKRFDTAMPSNSINCDSGLEGRHIICRGREAPDCLDSITRKARKADTKLWRTCRFLIVSTLRAFVSSVDTIPGPDDPGI
jgi:hypothetical protein